MKSILKIFFAATLCAAALSGCTLKEEVNLAGYAPSAVGLTISDLDSRAAVLNLKAVYNSEGKLELDGVPTHDYSLRLSTVSSQDMALTLEPISTNIPADKVWMSKTAMNIPAGYAGDTLKVIFKDEDFNFAASEKAAKTYEIGVRVSQVRGFNTSLEGAEAKVVIEKEAYRANLTVADPAGRDVTIKRAYWDGAILNAEPMSHTFKVSLDKPADADVTVSFSLEGLPAAFASDWSVTPATAVIPAGSLESEELTWTLSDDFLLTTDQGEKYELALKSSFESSDPTVVAVEGAQDIALHVEKMLDAMEVLTAKPAEWVKYPSSGWVVSHTGLFNGNAYDYTFAPVVVTVDMLEVKALKGFNIRSYADLNSYNAGIAEVFISDDGENWSSIGVKEQTTVRGQFVLNLMGSMSTRYLKFELTSGRGYGYVSEVEIYN